MIDVRSDTVTRPTPEMMAAISKAELGDDYYRDDLTVLALEEEAADLLAKPAAVLVLSGTMANIVSALALGGRGGALVAEANSHVLINESGWVSSIAGLTPAPLETTNGIMTADALRSFLRARQNRLTPPAAILCIENTHNAAGGRAMTVEHVQELARIAHAAGLRVHLDGARLFNAAVALNSRPGDFARAADTVTVCLSKGLCCPAGSLVAGSTEIVAEVRRWRQVIGGGMRQAGIIAAAGRVALRSMIDRLSEDHATAHKLARALQSRGLKIDPAAVETNILFIGLTDALFSSDSYVSELRGRGILANPPRNGRLRLVTHIGVRMSDVERIATAVAEAVAASLTVARTTAGGSC